MPAMRARAPLFQSPEVSEERSERLRVELVRRHFRARLDALRIEDPAGEISDSVGQRARRNSAAAGQVGKIGPVMTAGASAADRMTHRAGAAEKNALARL